MLVRALTAPPRYRAGEEVRGKRRAKEREDNKESGKMARGCQISIKRISAIQLEEVCLSYKNEGLVEWQNLWNFQERRWAENFPCVQSFFILSFSNPFQQDVYQSKSNYYWVKNIPSDFRLFVSTASVSFFSK